MSHFIASKDRPLALRLRPDVVEVRVEMAGAPTWIVKDPLSLEHFHFSEEEFALIELLRQHASLAQLKREFEQRFPPRTITDEEVWAFVSQLHEAGLLMSDSPGQGDELVERMRQERLRTWTLSAFQLTAIRFRGVNPDRFLTVVHERCRWLFSRTTFFVAVSIVLLALSIVIGHGSEFRARLPELSAFADIRNLIWLLVAIGSLKVLHELGHALACKHFGGEVHEMGLMLLVFAPCLYCDVSDAWRLPSKWQRIVISAAGMLVELVLASLAAIVWWYAEPGILQLVALDVMLVATVSTLLVNGNPLLRYDGYYILSDLVESPNLWQRSREVLRTVAASWLLGQPPDDDRLVPVRHRAGLVIFGIASKLYLAFVMIAIVWGLVRILHPWHLQTLAYAIGVTAIGGTLVGPVVGAARFVQNPIRRRELRGGRLATIAGLSLAALVMLLAWPVNYYVYAPLALLPAEAARIYTTVEGTLADALPAGRHVEAGQPIAHLGNPEIQLEVARLAGEYELQRLKLDNLERLRAQDPEASAKIPAARSTLDDLAERLADRQHDAERLTLVAPQAGAIIAAPHTEPPQQNETRLATWSGAILDGHNQGALVKAGTLVALVGDANHCDAMLLVDDTDIARVRPGQTVRLRFDQLPGQVIEGEVGGVSRHDTATADSASARADLAPLFAGLVPPGRSNIHYQVRVQFERQSAQLAMGGHGEAKIAAERITFAKWILRRLAQTFRLPT